MNFYRALDLNPSCYLIEKTLWISFLCGAGHQTQALVHDKHILYHWDTPSASRTAFSGWGNWGRDVPWNLPMVTQLLCRRSEISHPNRPVSKECNFFSQYPMVILELKHKGWSSWRGERRKRWIGNLGDLPHPYLQTQYLLNNGLW